MNIAQNVDWYILPMANPDGFQHTRAVVSFLFFVLFDKTFMKFYI